ncbi:MULTISPECIES: hypothetical protein [Corynebacterium]|uniref:hypothetical protein n=1 Tax=Corynebacterium TaxID=1716 RepID=UPI001EEC1540|nr:hypothetical protein [Corynebacterium sp. BWA136]MDK2583939.1 hypothetical protein [Corynebacterium sp. BWA136]
MSKAEAAEKTEKPYGDNRRCRTFQHVNAWVTLKNGETVEYTASELEVWVDGRLEIVFEDSETGATRYCSIPAGGYIKLEMAVSSENAETAEENPKDNATLPSIEKRVKQY